MSQPRIDVTLDGLRELRSRIDRQALAVSDWPLIGALVTNLLGREELKVERLENKITAQAALAAAAAASGAASETVVSSSASGDGGAIGTFTQMPGVRRDDNEGGDDGTASDAPPADTPPSRRGHGRNGAASFTRATDVFHSLAKGVIGSLCSCGSGWLTAYRDRITIRVVGQPMFGAEKHHAEQGRCRVCGRVVTATLPAEATAGLGKAVTYHWSACAMLIVLHYFCGLPFKRLEGLHQAWGIPFADANQWEIVRGAMKLLEPMIQALSRFAVEQMTSFRMDDTGSMILTLKRQIATELEAAKALGLSDAGVRRGINASGFYIETPAGPVLLYFTGRHHAAEILCELIKKRLPGAAKISKVTDGASKNFLGPEYADLWEEGVCNVHALLKFRDIKAQNPAEYAIAGEAYAKIYAADAIAKEQKMSPEERLAYHQEHSRPWMEKIKAMCVERITSRTVEPNSAAWGPIYFFINQWPRLTKFLEVPGMPLDTNVCEQSLIVPVRYLAASFNYHTESGAEVGDHGMSLVATARANGAEPVAWLTDCLDNHTDLAAHPERYFPWTYRERMAATADPDKPPDPSAKGR